MKKIEPLWHQVVVSQSVQAERTAIDKLKSHIASDSISFKTTLLDSQGNEIDYNDLNPDFQLTAVRIQFFADGGTFEGGLWKPKDPENLYRLYRE